MTRYAFVQHKDSLHSVPFLLWMQIGLVPTFAVVAAAAGEFEEFFDYTMASGNHFWRVTGTASLGGVRALSGFIALSHISATSAAVLEGGANGVNALIAIPLRHLDVRAFELDPTTAGVLHARDPWPLPDTEPLACRSARRRTIEPCRRRPPPSSSVASAYRYSAPFCTSS